MLDGREEDGDMAATTGCASEKGGRKIGTRQWLDAHWGREGGGWGHGATVSGSCEAVTPAESEERRWLNVSSSGSGIGGRAPRATAVEAGTWCTAGAKRS
jgi:hypothetical protein